MLTGIGFTMALFIAEPAFDNGVLTSVKLAILAARPIRAPRVYSPWPPDTPPVRRSYVMM